MKRHSRFDVIYVDQDDIAKGAPTFSGNPICRALRHSGFQGARTSGDGFLQTYDGRRWTLRMMPKPAQKWLARFVDGKNVKPFRFGLPKVQQQEERVKGS